MQALHAFAGILMGHQHGTNMGRRVATWAKKQFRTRYHREVMLVGWRRLINCGVALRFAGYILCRVS